MDDQVGYRQHAVWLSPEELREAIEGMRGAIAPHLANAPEDGRTQYLLSPILFPIAALPAGTDPGTVDPPASGG